MTESLARDQKVVSADRFTNAFEGRPNTPRMVGVLSGEVKDLDVIFESDTAHHRRPQAAITAQAVT
jgi:hypothetical protein